MIKFSFFFEIYIIFLFNMGLGHIKVDCIEKNWEKKLDCSENEKDSTLSNS